MFWLCVRLKHFVDVHLWTLIVNPYRVATMEEWGKVLSLPRKFRELQKKLSWLQRIVTSRSVCSDYQI